MKKRTNCEFYSWKNTITHGKLNNSVDITKQKIPYLKDKSPDRQNNEKYRKIIQEVYRKLKVRL